MNADRYIEIVRQFRGAHVTVLGDLMMDEYLWGRATRISPESPVMVVEVDRETRVPGGAANVVNNLLSLGAHVRVIGVVGNDEAGDALVAALTEKGADTSGIITDPSRPTTRKTRVVAHNQQVLRVDRERAQPISEGTAEAIHARLNECAASPAILISDYNKGVLTASVARAVRHLALRRSILTTANPKPANVHLLEGLDLVSLNRSEAEALKGPGSFARTEALWSSGEDLRCRLGIRTLVVTLGPDGLALFHTSGAEHVPAHPVEVFDVAGAGDTVISTLTLALVCGATLREAAVLANHAASCVVRKVGVATVTPGELIADWTGDPDPGPKEA
ncbi:MAG: bifunctional heptose 7-phosphate kinase/heptose 1-phosphate adenyltransferase [Chthonomonadales bacterium]